MSDHFCLTALWFHQAGFLFDLQMKSFKYRLYPTKKQEKVLDTTLETCRRLYNSALEQRIKLYKEEKKSLSFFDQCKELTKFKDEYQKIVYTQVLRGSLSRLDKAFKAFFKGLKKKQHVGFPRFRSKNRYRSFYYPQLGFSITKDCKHINLAKIGCLKLKYSRSTEGKIKTCTILKDVDQWFVILCCEADINNPNQVLISEQTKLKPSVGIDVGLKIFAQLSDGTSIDNPRFFRKSEKKLKQNQRWLSRKKKGSKNRVKQRIKVAKIYRKIRRQREDFLHKVSTILARKYSTVCFEKLTIQNMLKNHKLAKSISDASWNKLITLTTYKAANAGGLVVLINPRGTSQTCSSCGYFLKIKPTLSDRTFTCPVCHLTLDRDLNSALEIKKRGLNLETSKFQEFLEFEKPDSLINTARNAEIYACGDNVRLDNSLELSSSCC